MKRILLLSMLLLQAFTTQANIHEEFKRTFADVDLSKEINSKIFEKFKSKENSKLLMQREVGKDPRFFISAHKRNEKILSLKPWCKNFPELLADFEVTTTKNVYGQIISMVEGPDNTAILGIEQKSENQPNRIEFIDLKNLNTIVNSSISEPPFRMIKLQNGCYASLHRNNNTVNIIYREKKKGLTLSHEHLESGNNNDNDDTEGDKLNSLIEIAEKIITFSQEGIITKWSNPRLNYWDKETFNLNCGIYCATKVDKRTIILGLVDGRVALYDHVNNGATFFDGHNNNTQNASVNSIIKLSNGKMLSSADNGTLIVWDIESMEKEQVCKPANYPIHSTIELTDGTIAFISSFHSDISLIPLESIIIFDLKSEMITKWYTLQTNQYVEAIMQLNNGEIAAGISKDLIIFDLYGQLTEELNLEQTVLYVQLIRNYNKGADLHVIHSDWMNIFNTLPAEIQNLFQVEELVQEQYLNDQFQEQENEESAIKQLPAKRRTRESEGQPDQKKKCLEFKN